MHAGPSLSYAEHTNLSCEIVRYHDPLYDRQLALGEMAHGNTRSFLVRWSVLGPPDSKTSFENTR